ncbi:MAG: hypothetical protein U0353_03035 [Sandaracinus sp.]
MPKNSAASKAATKNAPTKNAPTKNAPTKNAPTKSAPTKSAPTKNAPTKKAATKKAATKGSTVKSLASMASARAKTDRAREARALLDAIGRKLAAAEESFYEIGAALSKLREPAMFGAAGFDTFEALLASIPKLSREVAYRCMRIATSYDEPTALALAQSKALALLTYVDATPEPDDAQALAEADATIGGIAISQQTAEGILRAAAEARPPSKRRERRGEAEAKRSGSELETRLRKALGRGVEVRVALRKKEWRLVVDVPAEAAARLTLAKK